MKTLRWWGGLARISRDPPQEPLAIAHALGHHEIDLVVLVEQFVVERGRARSPARDIEQALRPVHVTTPGIPVLVDERGDAAVLARVELHYLVHLNDVGTFRQLQLGPKGPGVVDLVDIDLDRAADLAHGGGIVAHVIPRARIRQRADLIDALAGDDEPPVVEVVLFGKVDTHLGAGLQARPAFWLGRRRLRRGLGQQFFCFLLHRQDVSSDLLKCPRLAGHRRYKLRPGIEE